MSTMPFHKYRPFTPIDLPDRTWPNQTITKAPNWCSVDLRDGNQALINPMTPEKKGAIFAQLLEIGFKEIEVGFPAASKDDFDFTRHIIENNLIPKDVTIQVLVQARKHLIERTFEAIRGARRVIVHMYNSTSTLQRRVVFRKSREEIKQLAIDGIKLVKKMAANLTDTEIQLQYSPESFTGTELDFAVDICQAVVDTWDPKENDPPVILNLPATVEMATANTYADQIEWFCRNLPSREKTLISLHAHNDRGTAVAATELALMAGADRVEGTLFGNGERTGNVDIITVALNMFSQGVDPKLDFGNIAKVVQVSEAATEIPVSVRHPYAGELVFTAFSGSHQDAIRKGMILMRKDHPELWEVPYLPIDPADLGQTYEPIIRINSQSGKGGVAYILEEHFGFRPPKEMQGEISQVIQKITDQESRELTPEEISTAFKKHFCETQTPFMLLPDFKSRVADKADPKLEQWRINAKISFSEEEHNVEGLGNGPLSALVDALEKRFQLKIRILNYAQHALGEGRHAVAVSYVQVEIEDHGLAYGVGLHTNINVSPLYAVINAINRTWKA
ncbi:2-isopropylmalate synthase [Magnetococcales bacterium HHB-1]